MIINKPTVINKVVADDFYITNTNVILNGITSGKIFLSETSSCNIKGIHNGDVINHGGFLRIDGVLNGNIENNGEVHIYGNVNNSIITGDHVFVHKNAIVNKIRQSFDEEI